MRPVFSSLVILLFAFIATVSYGQQCGNRRLDPEIAAFLIITGYKHKSSEQLSNAPIEQLEFPLTTNCDC